MTKLTLSLNLESDDIDALQRVFGHGAANEAAELRENLAAHCEELRARVAQIDDLTETNAEVAAAFRRLADVVGLDYGSATDIDTGVEAIGAAWAHLRDDLSAARNSLRTLDAERVTLIDQVRALREYTTGMRGQLDQAEAERDQLRENAASDARGHEQARDRIAQLESDLKDAQRLAESRRLDQLRAAPVLDAARNWREQWKGIQLGGRVSSPMVAVSCDLGSALETLDAPAPEIEV